MLYKGHNKSQKNQTANPSKYPQGKFNPKPCRGCGKEFAPMAPSSLYCSDECKDRAYTTAYMQRTYGITYDDYEAMLYAQDHKCCICGGEGYCMDKDRHKLKLVIDHDHETGNVRGLLCHNCNRALGLFHDDTEALTSAVKYLEGATTIRKE